MMSILNAYKPLLAVPAISRLFSISHTKSSTTETSAEDRERYHQNQLNRRFKLYTDLEYRKRYLEQKKGPIERYKLKPESRARYREYARMTAHVKGSYLGPMGYPWNKWLRTIAWVRDELDWMSHVPVWSDVRVERNCELCNYPRANGSKLWWVRT